MRQFIKRALQKLDKLDAIQLRDLLVSSSREVELLETVMDSLHRGILVCDIAHKLILANKAARRFLSIVSYETARESLWSVVPDERVSAFLAGTLIATDKAEEREFQVDVNGMAKLISVSVMPLVQDQKISGSLVLIDDITERKAREARMRRAENLASLTTLAAGVAHEIKNPLGALSIHVQLIRKAMAAQEKLCNEIRGANADCDPEGHFRRIEKHIGVVTEEIERLNGIVVDFLFAVRPMNAKLMRGDINTLVAELADFVSGELKNSRVEIMLNLADNMPALDFDERLMKQALLNLVNNAAAAMSAGGKLSITTEAIEDEAIITIADNGVGISGENLSKIFEPYYTTKENGTGLGLTVAFKIVKEHQGEIIVKSREGEGTVFTITLPVPRIDRRQIAYKEDT